jgi:hypothetical protein
VPLSRLKLCANATSPPKEDNKVQQCPSAQRLPLWLTVFPTKRLILNSTRLDRIITGLGDQGSQVRVPSPRAYAKDGTNRRLRRVGEVRVPTMLNDLLRTTEMEVLTVRPALYRTNSVVTGLPPIRAASKLTAWLSHEVVSCRWTVRTRSAR